MCKFSSILSQKKDYFFVNFCKLLIKSCEISTFFKRTMFSKCDNLVLLLIKKIRKLFSSELLSRF